MIRFYFDEAKAVETLVYVASAWPKITPFYLSKVLFIADRDHLRQFGRPVTGDAYIAMDNGPVPSRVYDIIMGTLDFFGNPAAIDAALTIKQEGKYHLVTARRKANTDLLSETDIVALDSFVCHFPAPDVQTMSTVAAAPPFLDSLDLAIRDAGAVTKDSASRLQRNSLGQGSAKLRDGPRIVGA